MDKKFQGKALIVFISVNDLGMGEVLGVDV